MVVICTTHCVGQLSLSPPPRACSLLCPWDPFASFTSAQLANCFQKFKVRYLATKINFKKKDSFWLTVQGYNSPSWQGRPGCRSRQPLATLYPVRKQRGECWCLALFLRLFFSLRLQPRGGATQSRSSKACPDPHFPGMLVCRVDSIKHHISLALEGQKLSSARLGSLQGHRRWESGCGPLQSQEMLSGRLCVQVIRLWSCSSTCVCVMEDTISCWP